MNPNMAWRLFGLLLIAMAAGIGLWGIWLPYQEALAQAPRVYYRIATFVFVPFAAVFGVFFVIFGASVPYRDAEAKKATPAGMIVMAIAALASGLTFWWFNARFDELGYPYPGANRVEKQEIIPLPDMKPAPVERPDFSK